MLEEFKIGSLGAQSSPELLELQSLAFVEDPINMLDVRRCRRCGDLHAKANSVCKVEDTVATVPEEKEEVCHEDSIFAVGKSSVESPVSTLCQYKLCQEKNPHMTRVCKTLHAKCTMCMYRGHTATSLYHGRHICPSKGTMEEESAGFSFRELGGLFERVADDGLLTQYRHQHPPFGFFSFAGKAEAAVLTSLTFDNLARAGLANVSRLCGVIRNGVREAMAGIGDRSKEYERDPCDDMAAAMDNIVTRRNIVEKERSSHMEAISHQLSVAEACEEFLERNDIRPGERHWAEDRIEEAAAAIRQERGKLAKLLINSHVMERGSAQSSWSTTEVWDSIGKKASSLIRADTSTAAAKASSSNFVSSNSTAVGAKKRTTEMPPPPTPFKQVRTSSQGQASGSRSASGPSNLHARQDQGIAAALTSGVRRRLGENARFWVEAFDQNRHCSRESDLPALNLLDLASIPEVAKEKGTSRVFTFSPLKEHEWVKILGRYWTKWDDRKKRYSFQPAELELKRRKAKVAMEEADSAGGRTSSRQDRSYEYDHRRSRDYGNRGHYGGQRDNSGSRGRARRY